MLCNATAKFPVVNKFNSSAIKKGHYKISHQKLDCCKEGITPGFWGHPPLPWVRSRVKVWAGLELALREAWVDRSPECWIDTTVVILEVPESSNFEPHHFEDMKRN